MVGYREPTLSLAEAYHAAQTWLVHAGAVPERVDEPVDGVIEMQGGGLFSRIRFDRSGVGQAAILALMKHADDTADAPVLFSVSGYSHSAEAFGENHGVALFAIDATGDVMPLTAAARTLMPTEPFIPPFSEIAAERREAEEAAAEEPEDEPEEAEDEPEVPTGSWQDCPDCGTSHHRDAAFCVSCGTDLSKRVVHLKKRPAANQPNGTPVPSADDGRPTLRCRTCGSSDIELLNNS